MRNDTASADNFTVETESVATGEWTTGDTSISFVNVPSTLGGTEKAALNVKTTPKHSVIGLASKLKTQVCAVNMTARDLPEDDSQRSAVDIIVALDVSGSMSGYKLDLCKKTLLLLLRVLFPQDRFGLIAYAENATIEIPVQKMNGANKKKCIEKIETLGTRGCTNISAAVGLAREEMRQIETPNEVQTVFLLTDGQANAGIVGIKGNDLLEYTKNCFVDENFTLEGTEGAEDHAVGRRRRASWFRRMTSQHRAEEDKKPASKPAAVAVDGKAFNPITLHCFGVGTDHDSNLLQNMADTTPGGTYYFIEKDADIGTAFGDALGGILSVVAQSVVVTISVPEEAKAKGVQIVKVYHDNIVKRENGSYTVVVGDFYAEESRDVLFDVQLANSGGSEEPCIHAEISVSYTDTILKIPATANATVCMIARPLGDELSPADPHVEVQWTRLMATQAMERANQMAQANDFEGAKACLRMAQEKVRRTKGSTPAAYNASLDFLDADMSLVSAGMSSAREYASVGAHTAKSTMQMHSKQRCSTVRSSAYSSKKKCSMKKQFC